MHRLGNSVAFILVTSVLSFVLVACFQATTAPLCLQNENRFEGEDVLKYWHVELTSNELNGNQLNIGIRLTNLDTVSHIPPTRDLKNYVAELFASGSSGLVRSTLVSLSNNRFFRAVSPCGSASTILNFELQEELTHGEVFEGGRLFSDLLFPGMKGL